MPRLRQPTSRGGSTAIPDFIYGTAWKEDRTAQLVSLALRAGFRAFDTANQRKHYFEAAVGDALADAYRDGTIARSELFLQTKFTYRDGQDHRLPYDPKAPAAEQVAQSLASSLEHLHTDYVDSFLLHGPSSHLHWTETDSEVWDAMLKELKAGRALSIGVSNVSVDHLQEMTRRHKDLPAFVQNRCYARFGWDREVRGFCREHGIVYQGFSLLTANIEVLRHPAIVQLAAENAVTPAQVVFSFARSIGILPLTGTSDPTHMQHDLARLQLELPQDVVHAIERLSG
jgi:diketogulonate reductase-like aldo/keto reductase